jgi:DNA polymerase I
LTTILIDGKNVCFRFGMAQRSLKTTDGVCTGAIYGALGTLIRLKKRFPDSKLVVVWDGDHSREGWRFKAYPGYKANRTKNSDALQVLNQIPVVEKLIDLLGLEQYKVDRVEADDLISILAHQVRTEGGTAIVYSSDKDFYQLMHFGIRQIRDTDKTHTLRFETEQDVWDHFYCRPGDILAVRAICGDPSDGIAGIQRGVGPVKASQMVLSHALLKHLSGSSVLATYRQNLELMQLPVSQHDPRIVPYLKGPTGKITPLSGKITPLTYDRYIELLTLLSNLQMADHIANRFLLLNLSH